MSDNQVERRLSVLQSWVTFGLAFILLFSISVMGIMVWQSYRLGANANELRGVATETHSSLCAFKTDLQTRHENSVKYLQDHPSGLVAHGEVLISPAQIQQSLDAQSATLSSLSGLDCTSK